MKKNLPTGEPYLLNRFDSLFRGMRGLVWTVDLGLLATLATRLLSGGSGLIEIVAIAVPSAIALFQANNELSAKGQEQNAQYKKIKLIPPVLFLFALGIVWCLQPQIADYFNQEGFNQQWPEYLEQCKGQEQNSKYCRKQLVQAEQNYLKAIAFDSKNLKAHYNLGTLYEDLQDVDNARKYYAIAAKGGFPEAYNNLARLLIQKKEYPQAVILLQQGLLQADEQNSYPEDKYNFFKNLGWVRFEQGRDIEAQKALETAIEISSDPEVSQKILNKASAHCILAQVLERQKHPSALQQWQKCSQLSYTLNPDEDTWLYLANKKLKDVKK